MKQKLSKLLIYYGIEYDTGLFLTVSLARVIYPGKVLVAAAFVGALGVVADLGANSKLQTLVLIWETENQTEKMSVKQNIPNQFHESEV